MKFLLESNDSNEMHSFHQLLEEKGIPAIVFENKAPKIPNKIALHIYLNEQFNEAKLLIENSNYNVINQVDIPEFYTILNNESSIKELKQYKLNFIIYGLGFIILVVIAIGILLNE